MPELVNMKMSAEEAKQFEPTTVAERPEYPYGLSLNLGKESLDKLGIKSLPEVGQKMNLVATVEVTAISQSESSHGGGYKSVSLQITDMALSKEGKKKDASEAAEALYGGASPLKQGGYAD